MTTHVWTGQDMRRHVEILIWSPTRRLGRHPDQKVWSEPGPQSNSDRAPPIGDMPDRLIPLPRPTRLEPTGDACLVWARGVGETDKERHSDQLPYRRPYPATSCARTAQCRPAM